MSLISDIDAALAGRQGQAAVKVALPPRPDLALFSGRLDSEVAKGNRAKPVLDFVQTIEWTLHLEGVVAAQAKEIASLQEALESLRGRL